MAQPDRPATLDEFPEDGPPALTAAEHPFVEEAPDRNGGYPVLRNTSIAVRTIVIVHRLNRGLAETLQRFAWLPREQVEGALDYYVRFPTRVDEDIEPNQRAWVEHRRAEGLSDEGPSEDGAPPLAPAEHPHVEEVPGRCGGYPVVHNTRIPLWVIVSIHRQGRDLADTVKYFSTLTPEQVAGALDYYVRFPDRVNEDFERNKRAWIEVTGQPWPD